MNRKLMKRLQQVSHRVNTDRTEVAESFLGGLQKYMASRGHRADLALSTKARDTNGRFSASVRFDATLGYPEDTDLLALVAQAYPTHEIDWDLADVDMDLGLVLLQLEPSVEVVPVESMNQIPPEFKAIGSGIYKRARDASGNVNEIWTLSKGTDGLMLYRNPDDLEVSADDNNEFSAGDVVNTPHGPGRIQRFDEVGNAIVTIGSAKRLVAASDMYKYDVKKEKKKLEDYYATAYGDREFAKGLIEDFETKSKK